MRSEAEDIDLRQRPDREHDEGGPGCRGEASTGDRPHHHPVQASGPQGAYFCSQAQRIGVQTGRTPQALHFCQLRGPWGWCYPQSTAGPAVSQQKPRKTQAREAPGILRLLGCLHARWGVRSRPAGHCGPPVLLGTPVPASWSARWVPSASTGGVMGGGAGGIWPHQAESTGEDTGPRQLVQPRERDETTPGVRSRHRLCDRHLPKEYLKDKRRKAVTKQLLINARLSCKRLTPSKQNGHRLQRSEVTLLGHKRRGPQVAGRSGSWGESGLPRSQWR